MSNKTEELVNALSELTVLEMAELKTALEEKWGVKAAAAAVAVAAPAGGAGAGEAAAAEPTEYDIILEAVPADKKIAVIKVVREITQLGLKEAKDLVDSAPKPLREQPFPKEEAKKVEEQIKTAGGKATLKGR